MTLGKMTVVQLREALAEKGLDTSGLKAALVARLEEAHAGSEDPTGASARSRTRGVASPDAKCRRAGGRRSDDAIDAGARRSPPTKEKGARDRPRPDATPPVFDARVVSRARRPLASPRPSASPFPSLTPTDPDPSAAGDRPAAPEGDEPPKEMAPESGDDDLAVGTAGEAPEKKVSPEKKATPSPSRAARSKRKRDAADAADAATKAEAEGPVEDESLAETASKKTKTRADDGAVPDDAKAKAKAKAKTKDAHSVEVRVKGNEGRVIGKGGETIRSIEIAHGVKIEMKRERGVAVVAGADPVAVAQAGEAVRDVAEKGETRGSARGVSGGAMPPYGGGYAQMPQRGTPLSHGGSIPAMPISLMREPDPGEVLPAELQGDDLDAHVEIQVPCPGKEGRVIGKGGATIKELERQSGAAMKVVKGSGVCDIKGPKRLVIRARRAVLDTLALQVDRFVGTSGPVQGGDWTCPACSASVFGSKDKCFACGTPKPAGGAMAGGTMGGMMGSGMGGMMGQMGAMSAMGAMGAMGAVSHAAAPHVYGSVPYGTAAPYGGYAPPAYGQVAGSIPGGSGQTSLEVPCRGSEGRIIGKGGEMIKYIQTSTGAKLDMKRDVGTVLISGTANAVAKAQGLVLEVIENGDTRDKGGLVPGAYAAAAVPGDAAGTVAGAAPGMMAGGAAPVMVAVPMGTAPGAFYAAPHAAAGGYQLQQAYAAPMAAAPYGTPQHLQAQQAYDPAAAAQAAAAAEWGQAAQQQQQQQQQQQAVQAQQQQAPQQTGEWQTHYSEGRAYYYNVATGETRWA